MNRMQLVPQAALDVTREFFLAAKTHLECPHCDLLVIGEKNMLWSHHSSGWFLHMRGEGVARGTGLSWLTLEENRIQLFHNPGTHPRVVGAKAHLAPQGVQLSAPMYSLDHQPLAVIHLLRSASQPFNAQETAWLETQCARISPVIESALRSDAEFQDLIMERSSNRTRQLLQRTLDFAIYLGESPVYARAVALGTLLLSQEIPSDLLKTLAVPLETCDVLEYHHARFDGTEGLNLSGAQIPVAARIAKVTAAFEQQLELGWDIQRTLAWLRREAGWQFDPLLVKAFEQYIQTQDESVSKKLEPLDSSLAM